MASPHYFLSIDVQGAEDVVLQSADLGMVGGGPTAFKVILTEVVRCTERILTAASAFQLGSERQRQSERSAERMSVLLLVHHSKNCRNRGPASGHSIEGARFNRAA